MSTRTEELTAHEKAELERYYDKYLRIGTSTDPADKPRAEAAIVRMYAQIELPPPEFRWYSSPGAVVEALEADGVAAVDTFLWGQHDAYWVAYYTYAEKVLGAKYDPKDSELLSLWDEIAQSCMWWWPFEGVCYISDRPSECHLHPERGLHRDGGPALAFRDGKSSLYMLNGVDVPEWLVMTPAEQIDPTRVKSIENAQVRAEFIRKVGAERILAKCSTGIAHAYRLHKEGDRGYLAEVDAKGKVRVVLVPNEHTVPQPGREDEGLCTINQALYACSAAGGVAGLPALPEVAIQGIPALDHYELHLLDFEDRNPPRPYLLMNNPSVPELVHAECTPQETRTVDEALRFRNHLAGRKVDPVAGADWQQQGDVLLFPKGAKAVKPFPRVLT